MDEHQYLEDAQYDLNKARIAVYKNGWRNSKIQYIGEKRIAVLSNTIARNRSFQQSTCDLFKSLPVSTGTACRSQA